MIYIYIIYIIYIYILVILYIYICNIYIVIYYMYIILTLYTHLGSTSTAWWISPVPGLLADSRCSQTGHEPNISWGYGKTCGNNPNILGLLVW